MSKIKVPILPIGHRVIFPGSTIRVTIPNISECKLYAVARGKKLTIFGILSYKDAEKKQFYNYGTLVGVIHESPVVRSKFNSGEVSITSFLNTPVASFSRNDSNIVAIGAERFKVLSVSEEGRYLWASIQIEKDTNTKAPINLIEDLRKSGAHYIQTTRMADPHSRE